MRTTLYHASVPGGPTGISFQIGETTLFAPVDEDALYVMRPGELLVQAPVPAGMAEFVAQVGVYTECM